MAKKVLWRLNDCLLWGHNDRLYDVTWGCCYVHELWNLLQWALPHSVTLKTLPKLNCQAELSSVDSSYVPYPLLFFPVSLSRPDWFGAHFRPGQPWIFSCPVYDCRAVPAVSSTAFTGPTKIQVTPLLKTLAIILFLQLLVFCCFLRGIILVLGSNSMPYHFQPQRSILVLKSSVIFAFV